MNTQSRALMTGQLPNGAYVTEVEPNSPAEQAGIQVGDIIVDVNNTVITSTNQLTSIIQGMQAGDELQVKFYRVPGIEDLDANADIPDGEYINTVVVLAMLDGVKQ